MQRPTRRRSGSPGRPRSADARGRTRRERILRAAEPAFAARGYDATSVEGIARMAGVNKALIYYYFGSKLGLYQHLLADMVAGLHAPLAAVVEGPGTASQKLARYVAALVEEMDRRIEAPPIILREIADGGRRLSPDTLRRLVGLMPLLRQVLRQGRKEGRFRGADPVLVHFVLMGSTLFFAGNAPIRRRVRALGLADPPLAAQPFIRHLQAVLRRGLQKDS